MGPRTSRCRFLSLATLPLAALALAQVDEPGPTPRESGLVESAERRIVQIDVSVEGKPELLTDMTRADFDIFVAGKPIDTFTVDPICDPAEFREAERARARKKSDESGGDDVEPAAPTRPSATYMLYFDQHHLTMAGRQGSLDAARDVLPGLLARGDRAMIVSAGESLETIVPLTDDLDALLAGLDRLESDRDQWDPYPYKEQGRVVELMETINDVDGENRAISIARQYQREERWRTERALRLFGFNLTRLTDLPHPKAVLYFADTMRQNPGEHYISFFRNVENSSSSEVQAQQGVLQAMQSSSYTAASPFDRVLAEAAAHGVRIYAVEGQGLSAPGIMTGAGRPGVAPGNLTRSRRLVDAQNSLTSMAHETGGEVFLNGIRGRKIAADIRKDMACVYLLTFDGGRLAVDQPLPVVVHVHRKGVKARHRGQIVVQSAEARRTGTLLAAFASPETTSATESIRTSLIPLGFEDGRFVAMVQLAVPASPLSGAIWDVGTSLVAREEVRDDDSARVELPAPGIPVIFETQFRFKPGPFELISVAHESTGNETVTGRLGGEWREPERDEVTVPAIAIVQPGQGVFLRDGETRSSGALVRDRRELARPELPTVVIGLVCAGKGVQGPLTLRRSIAGDDAVPFPEQTLDVSGDRCVQFRDFIPAGTMTDGRFEFTVQALDGESRVVAEAKDELVVAGDAVAAAAEPAGSAR